MSKAQSIQIDFPMMIDLPDDFQQRLVELVDEICNAYEKAHPDRVMWPFGGGSLITSMPVTDDEPIEFDDRVLHIEVSEREAHPSEIEQRNKKPAQRELHNRLAGKIISQIVKGPIDAGGKPENVLVLLESIVAGVVTVVSTLNGSGVMFDTFADGCRERIAKLALTGRPTAGNA